MCSCTLRSFVVLMIAQTCSSQTLQRGPPQFENKTMLLDSYIPAAMQILAYLTELMKYDLRPPTTPPYGPTTTSTMRPTPSHRPAIFAPPKPPGPNAYFDSLKKEIAYRDYVDSLKLGGGLNYFNRYHIFGIPNENKDDSSRSSRNTGDSSDDTVSSEDALFYFGKSYLDVVELSREIEPEINTNDLDVQAQEFLKKYDDSNFRAELWRQKQVPPTKAYVTLLSLYDLLNKESKSLGYSKYHGFSEKTLKQLVDSSVSTSAYQLRVVMNKIIERHDTRKEDIMKKIKQLVSDLDETNSYLNLALRYIPPLAFVL